MYTMKITIVGAIPIKKNKQRVSRHGGIYKHPEVRAYEELVGWHVLQAKPEPVMGPFSLSGTFWLTKRKDMDGALTTVLDCLQRAGAIENDKYLYEIAKLYKIPVKNKLNEQVELEIVPLH